MATALLRSLEVQSTIASHRSTESATGSTGTPHRMSSRLNAACMLACAASWRRKASPSARGASSAMRGSRRRASSMKKPSTTGAIAESASRNAVGPMPAGCQARGTSHSRPSKSKPGRRGVTVTRSGPWSEIDAPERVHLARDGAEEPDRLADEEAHVAEHEGGEHDLHPAREAWA